MPVATAAPSARVVSAASMKRAGRLLASSFTHRSGRHTVPPALAVGPWPTWVAPGAPGPHHGARGPVRCLAVVGTDGVGAASKTSPPRGFDIEPAPVDGLSSKQREALAKYTDWRTATASNNAGLAEADLSFVPLSTWGRIVTSFKLLLAPFWNRFKKDSVLTLEIGGALGETFNRFSTAPSLPQLCVDLKKAALDPRVSGILLTLTPLSAGWASLAELRRHIAHYRASGKKITATFDIGDEKSYYVALACDEIYVPPSAYVSLRGVTVGAAFLRGVLDKIGVEPQVTRIGKYKSAGDSLLRRDMAAPQREVLASLLEQTYANLVNTIASDAPGVQPAGPGSRAATGGTAAAGALLDAAAFDVEELLNGGWITGIMYEDEVHRLLAKRNGQKSGEPLRTVAARRYARCRPSTFGLNSNGRAVIGVIRAAGAITRGQRGGPSGTSTGITAVDLTDIIRRARQNKNLAAVVLRISSPGGDALASDLIWRELRLLAATKPVIASMGDVAASGGYFLPMACSKIVAETLTLTGSIGVIAGKINASELYKKAGYAKQRLSKGRLAELFQADDRPFTSEEQAHFEASALHAYEAFRDKAAFSRGLSLDAMEKVAQGRVWSGAEALKEGLVDVLGGFETAIAIAKQAKDLPLLSNEVPKNNLIFIQAAGMAASDRVRLIELTPPPRPSLAQLVGLGTVASGLGGQMGALAGVLGLGGSFGGVVAAAEEAAALSSGHPSYLMEPLEMGNGVLGGSVSPTPRPADLAEDVAEAVDDLARGLGF